MNLKEMQLQPCMIEPWSSPMYVEFLLMERTRVVPTAIHICLNESQHTTFHSSILSSYSHQSKVPPYKPRHIGLGVGLPLQPWESGYLRFKFILGSSSRSPWEDFASQRKVHGVIGICHCPHSPDIAEAYEDFMAACRAYPSAQARRCFAFDPSDAQVEQDDKQKKHLILFPWADPAKLSFLLATILQDFAADLLMGLESWVVLADRVGATFTTRLDSPAQLSAEEVSKSTKRRKGRMQKSVGDYCQLAGSPRDAHDHYLSAIEMARGCGDHFWHAGALEGMVSAIVVRTAGRRCGGEGGPTRVGRGGQRRRTQRSGLRSWRLWSARSTRRWCSSTAAPPPRCSSWRPP